MSTIDYNELPKQRLGQALEAARSIAGVSIDEAADMLGVSSRKLKRWEAGKSAPDADMAQALISVYGLDLGGQLAERTPIVFNSEAGGVEIAGRVIRYVPGVTDNDDFLEGYVAVVRELRGLEPESPIQLRSTDVAVLAGVLDLRDDDLDSKLAYWMGQPPGSMIGARHRLVMAAVLLGVVGAATIGGIVGHGASASASPSDTGGHGAAITHTLDGPPGPGGIPGTDLGNGAVQHTTATTSSDSSSGSGGHHVVMDFSPLAGLDLGVDSGGQTLNLDHGGSPAGASHAGGVDAGGTATAAAPTHAAPTHAPSAEAGSATAAAGHMDIAGTAAPSPSATTSHAPAPTADAPAAPAPAAPTPAPAAPAPAAPAPAAPAPAAPAPAPAAPAPAPAAPAPAAPAPAAPAPAAPAAPAPAPAPAAPAPAAPAAPAPAPAPAAPAAPAPAAPAPAAPAPATSIGSTVAPGGAPALPVAAAAAAATGTPGATSVSDSAATSPSPVPSTPVVSSSFEGTRQWARQNLNGEWASGWRGDGVALTGNQLWHAASGDTSVDMNANGPGTLSRTIDTQAGVHYQITFSLSGNPHGQRGVKTLDVHADGDTASFSTNTANISRNNMQWQTMTMDFVATGSSTDVSFQSTTPGAVGTVIDNITITPMG